MARRGSWQMAGNSQALGLLFLWHWLINSQKTLDKGSGTLLLCQYYVIFALLLAYQQLIWVTTGPRSAYAQPGGCFCQGGYSLELQVRFPGADLDSLVYFLFSSIF